jgi:hypothetical protein
LDAKGLVALWRETLLAQAVLLGNTKGYQNHPQLIRFRACCNPLASLSTYLWGVADEANNRNYCFDATKIHLPKGRQKISLTVGQLKFERQHLFNKLAQRDPSRYEQLLDEKDFEPHPLFKLEEGGIADWERP